MKPLRFCMVTTFYPPYHFGGDAVFVRALCELLAAEGHSVDVVHCQDAYLLRGQPPQNQLAHHERITVHRVSSRFGMLSPLITQQTGRPGLKRRALRRIFQQQFDVIHFHNISLIGGPGILAMGTAPVKLYTAHEHWLVCPTHVLWKNRHEACETPTCLSCCLRSGTPPQLWRYTGMLQRYMRHVDALLVPSEFTAQRHRDGRIALPIHVLPLFATIDTPPSSPPPGNPRANFLFVGRLTVPKGVLDLAEQFAQWPQFDLTVAGDGELLEPLRQRFANCPNIRLVGGVSRDRVVQLYQQATALIVPSLGPEAFGLVTVEAMACGTPVIVRQAGGSAEAVVATGGGVVYHTADELHHAVHRMAADPEWRNSLASQARRGYHQHYTPQVHLQRYFDIIRAIQAAKFVLR